MQKGAAAPFVLTDTFRLFRDVRFQVAEVASGRWRWRWLPAARWRYAMGEERARVALKIAASANEQTRYGLHFIPQRRQHRLAFVRFADLFIRAQGQQNFGDLTDQVHLLYINTTLLPVELRPSLFRRASLVAMTLFYGFFVTLSVSHLLSR